MKLVTNAAAISSLTGATSTAVFGQKENMGKDDYGKGTFRDDQFVFLTHTDNGLGHMTQTKVEYFQTAQQK